MINENRGLNVEDLSFDETGTESQISSHGDISTVVSSGGEGVLSAHSVGGTLSPREDGASSPHSTLRSPTDFSSSSSLVLSSASRPHSLHHLDHQRVSLLGACVGVLECT